MKIRIGVIAVALSVLLIRCAAQIADVTAKRASTEIETPSFRIVLPHLTRDNFERRLLQSNLPLVVYFYQGEMPGPADASRQLFERVAMEYYGNVVFVYCSWDEQYVLDKLAAHREHVQYPHVVLYTPVRDSKGTNYFNLDEIPAERSQYEALIYQFARVFPNTGSDAVW